MEIAGAYFCHLIGDEKFSILSGAPKGCMDFRDPTAFSRLNYVRKGAAMYDNADLAPQQPQPLCQDDLGLHADVCRVRG